MTSSSDPPAIRTFLIADVRGYTGFTIEHGDEEAARLATRFAEGVRRAVEPAGGELIELRGDEALVGFASARSAIRAALDVQRHCAEIAREASQPVGVGIGIDAGEAVPVLGGYRGKALNLAARLCSLAGAGEVLASDSVAHLAGRIEGIAYTERGRVRLKGFPEPVEVVGVERAAAPPIAGAPEAARPEARRLPIGSYLGSLPAGQLIAREAERERLLAAVEMVREASQQRTVLLAGEPGAGKTRLAQEMMLEVRNRGFAIGLGACLETRQAVPYYPFLDALTGIIEATGRSLDGWPYLQRLVAGSAESDAASLRAQAELDERVRREFADFLSGVADDGPLALLLDDLHWADDSSLQLLQHLVRNLGGRPVLLLGTYRDVEVLHEHALDQVLRELRRAELVEVIPVRRLQAAGTSALVAATFGEDDVSAEFAERIHQQTDGNPYFVQQVLRTLVERGDVFRQGAGWERKDLAEIEIPESIRSTIGERVARLPATAQEALRVASVLGTRFDFDDLSSLAELDPDDLEVMLERAVEAGLLRHEDQEGYAFEHAVAQQCLLEGLPPRRRRRLHSRAAQAIEGRRDAALRAGEIASHHIEADEPEPAARWWLTAATGALGLFAYAEAETHLRRAAEAAADSGRAPEEARALTLLGTVLRLRVKGQEAISTLKRAVEAAQRAMDPILEVSAVTELANTESHFGQAVAAARRLESFLAENGARLEDETRARSLLVLSRAYFTSGQLERMRDAAVEAEVAARGAGTVALIVEASGRLAHAVSELVGNRQAVAGYLVALDMADSSVPPDVMSVLHNNLAFGYFCLGQFDEHVRHRYLSAEFAEQFASPGQLAFAIAMCSQSEYMRGNLAAAAPLADRALGVAEGLTSWHTGYVRCQHASIAFQRGDLETAAAALRPILDGAVATSDIQLASWAVHVLGETLCEMGRHQEVLEVASEFLERYPDNVYKSRPLTTVAWAEVHCGRASAAVGHAEQAWTDFQARENTGEGVESLFVLGAAYSAAQRWTEADTIFVDGIARAASFPHKWALTRLHLSRAESLLARGQTDRAVQSLESARSLIEQCGYGALRPSLERLLEATTVPAPGPS